jgi:hypothetical protein
MSLSFSDPQAAKIPGAESRVAGHDDAGFWAPADPEPWWSVGAPDTTPSVRQSEEIPDVLNNIYEIPWW